MEPLQRLLATDLNDHEVRYLLAMNLEHAGDTVRSRKEMKRMEDFLSLRNRAEDLYDLPMRASNNPEYRENSASICDELGRPELARMWRDAVKSPRLRPR